MENRQATVRCAVYTRKSTDEGLDQDFNSTRRPAGIRGGHTLRASGTRDGCASPIGMTTADSPAATWSGLPSKGLFADIEAGDIDCVVVYKVTG
jgi:site-specific DNA recombinase